MEHKRKFANAIADRLIISCHSVFIFIFFLSIQIFFGYWKLFRTYIQIAKWILLYDNDCD